MPLRDEAERALCALVRAAEGRNETLWRLVRLPAEQRVRGVVTVHQAPTSAVVPLPKGAVSPVPVD